MGVSTVASKICELIQVGDFVFFCDCYLIFPQALLSGELELRLSRMDLIEDQVGFEWATFKVMDVLPKTSISSSLIYLHGF